MKNNQHLPTRIMVSCLPFDIFVSYEPFQTDQDGVDIDVLHNESGRELIKKMARTFYDEKDIDVFTQKNEKPKAFLDDEKVSVSFSHTRDGVSAALSKQWIVGCDMENVGRKVHPRLIERMRHKNEGDELYKNAEPVHIWTLKEAALKMIGTGLRKPMNSVYLEPETPQLFRVEFDNGKRAKICSFQHQYHWISICYRE